MEGKAVRVAFRSLAGWMGIGELTSVLSTLGVHGLRRVSNAGRGVLSVGVLVLVKLSV
jgi:hypothetical protein